MKLDEAKIQYLAARKNYEDACLLCENDRIANREDRYAAYNALKLAEIDLIDVAIDIAEDNSYLKMGSYDEIISNAALRRKLAELSMLLDI